MIGKLGYVQLDSIKIVRAGASSHPVLPPHRLSPRATSTGCRRRRRRCSSIGRTIRRSSRWSFIRIGAIASRRAKPMSPPGANAMATTRCSASCATTSRSMARRWRATSRIWAGGPGRGGAGGRQGGARIPLAHRRACGAGARWLREGLRPVGARHPQAAARGAADKLQTLDWAHNAALDRLGAGTARMIADFWGHASIPEAAAWIAAEKKKGRLIDVTLEGAPGLRGFQAVARPDIEAQVADLPAPTSRLRVLSPFDPVLRGPGAGGAHLRLRLSARSVRAGAPADLWLLRLPAARGRPLRRPHRHEGGTGQGRAGCARACGWRIG